MNKKTDYSSLPWNFEAFRRFLAYEVMQKAASVLCLFEGKMILSSFRELEEFQETLHSRTGLEWIPQRNISEDINFNVEGNIFRNKARVFTSFYLIDPGSLEGESPLVITDFCKALGSGFVSKDEFYKLVLSRYGYPHPAYNDNWDAWTAVCLSLKPFVFTLEILSYLHELDKTQSYLGITEFAEFAHPNPIHGKEKEIAKEIISHRKKGGEIKRERSDRVERKIADLYGFLCISGFCFYKNDNIALNLLGVHPEEKAHFYERRAPIDTFANLREFLRKALEG